jgi:hypothetical protein
VLALLAVPAFARGDDWERVPSAPDQGAATASGAATKALNKSSMACTLVGAFVEQTAKQRDKGATQESQLASIDKPNGKLAQLTIGNMLTADTSGMLRAGLHREVAYVYEHREMTPAQLGANARQTCGNPESSADEAAAPAAAPSNVR